MTTRDSAEDPWLATIAAFAACPSTTVSEDRRRAILTRVVDTIGCALGARSEDAVCVGTAYASRRSNDGRHAVWGTTTRTDVESAALANGVSTRSLDFNDAYFGAEPIHPSDVVPTMFAVALEQGRSDDEFLDAVAIAYEVAMTAADCITPRTNGFDHVNVTMLGAAAGTARLLGLSEAQARHAISIAVTSHAAYRQSRTGQLSMWKAFAAADACRHAVYAGLLASSGARGPVAPFTGQNAMFQRALNLTSDEFPNLHLVPGAVAERVGTTQIKRFPCGSVGQSAGQAATDLVADGIRLDDVQSIDIRLDPKAAALMVSPEKLEPETRETADHSIPYVIVSTLQNGDLTVASFADEAIFDEAVREFLHGRVTVNPDPALGNANDMGFPVALQVTLKDGTKRDHAVEHPPGSPLNPMELSSLRAKFSALVERSVVAVHVDELWDLTWSLRAGNMTIPRINDLLGRAS